MVRFRLFLGCLLSTLACLAQSNNNSTGLNTTSSGKKSYPPGNAWTLSWPLGEHKTAAIDTLLYGYQREFVPAIKSDAWASTGAFAAEGLDMVYFSRPSRSQFIFDDALMGWIPRFNTQKFYNVYIPMTLLTYNFGGNRENHTDRLKAVFAGNVNRKIGVGANVDYLYTKGAYSYQAAKDLNFGAQGYYAGDRYEMQAFVEHFNSVNQENGGITDDLYILDPAVLQGGVDKIETKSIPTNLTRARSRVIGAEFYMSHAYKLGFWRDVTTPQDTVQKEIFVPVTKFIYSFDYRYGHHIFSNSDSGEAAKFWQNTYFNSSNTYDHTLYHSYTNTFGIEMIEGFQRWAKFGLAAYASYEFDKFETATTPGAGFDQSDDPESSSSLTPLPAWVGHTTGDKACRNRLWIGGHLEKTRGSLLRYWADARFGLLGAAAGELDVSGEVSTRLRLGKDTVVVTADGFFRNTTPSYLLNHYVSNHFVWNNDFGKTRSFRVGGRVHIPWTKTDISAGVENIQNYIFFNSSSIPEQYGGSVQIFSAALEQKLKFGIWNWNNTLRYQATSNQMVIPLPAFTLYSDMFIDFTAFKVLHMMIGIDCNYYTSYRSPAYQPATMQFHIQGDNPTWTGNFAVANAYITAKIQKTRFFILWSHFNQGLFGNNYFSIPHYPVDPRQLRFGISIDFAN
ncbi:MAG: putative porin [Muribaculaceae bacterium]|nr:putative porin [Muribaculaceae bacterium]